jgi:hypothetical protein
MTDVICDPCRCTSRLEGSIMILLEAFIVYRAEKFSEKMMEAMNRTYPCSQIVYHPLMDHSITVGALTDAKARNELIEARDLTVSPTMIDLAVMADQLTTLCSIVLCEPPPAPQIRMMGGGNSGDSRGGSSHGDVLGGSSRRGSVGGRGSTTYGSAHRMSSYGLQLDIERMFSRKIKVFDHENMQLSLECIISVVCKVWLIVIALL